MKVQLSPSWALTDEHSGASYSQPALVKNTGLEVYYGPRQVLKASDSWGYMPAGELVKRLVKKRKFTQNERDFIRKFMGISRH